MSERFEFDVADLGTTSAQVYRAAEPSHVTLLLAHGAGAGQTHPFMIDMATRIAQRGVDVVTFNFLYTERGKKVPDRMPTLEATWHAAIASVRARVGLSTERLFIGGKSMGGRVASNIAAEAGESLSVNGLVFLGYPLYPPGKPAAKRDEHLPRIAFPMLFAQGARDSFGDAAAMKRLVKRLPHSSLVLVANGDHSLGIPKSEGAAAQSAALDAVADAIAVFAIPPKKKKPKR